VAKIQINPRTQIRWNNDAIPSGYDIPLDSFPAHAFTHDYGGSDEVLIQTSQVQGLDAALVAVGTYTHSDENETITGQWTFNQDTYFPSGITVGTLYVDVVEFQPIARPIDLIIGDVFRDQVDNKLYMQTSTGLRAFLFMDSPAPGLARVQLANALAYIAGTFKVALAQARAYIFRAGLAQTQARIVGKTYRNAQAQAKIFTVTKKSAQAQAKILGSRQQYAQSQASLDKPLRFAQAQTSIVQPQFPNLGLAQSNAKIRAYDVQAYANASAWIV